MNKLTLLALPALLTVTACVSPDSAKRPAASASSSASAQANAAARAPKAPLAVTAARAPAAIPGIIKAADYNDGGEGVGYHDTTAGNAGNLYRQDNVDIKRNTDAENASLAPYSVGWFATGEYLNYAANVATSGTYTMSVRVASAMNTGKFHVEQDGVNISGSLSVPNTGAWDAGYATVSASVKLKAGARTLKLVSDAEFFDVSFLKFTFVAPEAGPVNGTALAIPGTINAIDYDLGGEGVAYHDEDQGNNGGVYRSDDVDIKRSTDSVSAPAYVVGWFRAGEYLKYSVNIAKAATYQLKIRAAANAATKLHIEIDNNNVSNSIDIARTGDWDTTYATFSANVALPAGAHALKLVAEGDYVDVASLNFAEVVVTTPPTTPPVTPPPASTVGPITPVGPVANLACSGTALNPGANIQNAVNAAANGTTFCLSAGTYARQSITPKTGQKFIGAKGAILDGQNATVRAFQGTASDVTIQNLVIKNYTAGNQNAAVWASNGKNWIVRGNEISYNNGMGVYLGDGTQMLSNFVHHNGQAGFGCQTDGIANPKPLLIDSNEISFNNYQDRYDAGFEAGGGKITLSNNAMISHNYSHDNHGPGLWTDIDNINTTYAYNLVENNQAGGIFHEISYSASIHHNVVRNNAVRNDGWMWGAGIQISSSGGVGGGMIEIYENTVVSNSFGNGIGIMQQNRGNGAYGPWLVQNVWVHHNTVDMSKGGKSGVATDTGDRSIFTSRNVKLDYNTYILAGPGRGFDYNGAEGGKERLLNGGQEAHGVFK